jgi:hypothetical protein
MQNITLKKEDNFPFWKNLALVTIFFFATPIAIGTSLFSLAALANQEEPEQRIEALAVNSIEKPQSGARVFASLPDTFAAVSGNVESSDARPEIIRQYLADHNSPLEPYADVLVEAADKYDLDYRLLTAIAQQESNLCKLIPPGSHNCWGWGIHSEGTLGFSTYEKAIWTVSEGIKTEYIDKGFETTEEIMSKYTPLSPGSWAVGVNKFMGELE